MSKIRVYELAKKMGTASNVLVDELRALGIEVSSIFSTLDETSLAKLGGKSAAPLAPIIKKPVVRAAPPPPKKEIPKEPAPAKAAAKPPVKAVAKAAAAKTATKAPAAKTKTAKPKAAKAKGMPSEAEPQEAPPISMDAASQSEAVEVQPQGEAASEVHRLSPEPPPKPAPQKPIRPPGGGPMVHFGPGVNRPASAQGHIVPMGPRAPHAPAHGAAHRPGTPAGPRRAEPVDRARGAQAPPSPNHRHPFHPTGQPQQHAHRPGAPAQYGRPGPSAARPGSGSSQAPAPRAPETAKPAGRLAPVPEQRRKTKRERRIDKHQAKLDRREKLEAELQEARANAETGEAVFIREGITVKELADKLGIKVRDIIAKLMSRQILATINQPLDKQVAIEMSSMFGFAAEVISFEDELVLAQEESPEESKVPRAPVVTIMGHVDHGKSSLLEAIHDVDITSKEFGGITQHIGAYKVTNKGREYVFLDTPGHEAFTLMRARGAQVTDIVILVVAADDGVMPQTVEAINHCKAANVPIVVAINKIDKGTANPDRVKQDLMQHGVVVEDFGGEVVSMPVSAKSRQGIEELLELVSIVADMLNLKATPTSLATGTVLESRIDRARGPVATVLIQDGSIAVGDLFLCGTTYGHVRNLFDDKGIRVERAGPSSPIEVLGFPEVPMVGALFQGMDDEAKARQVASFRKEQEKQRALRTTKVRLENVFGAIQQGEIQELPLILKADVHGSLEAIAQNLQELSTDEIKIRIVHQGVGAISESDILLASASNALIIGFNVRPERKAAELAKAEGVDIQLTTVIYDLIERMRLALTGMLKPIEEEVILGHADVRQIFKVSKVGTVAGCIVSDGKILRSAKIRILRDNVVVHTGKLHALKRFKDDASEVKDGTECGISIENFNDVKPGDVLEAFEIRYQERTL